MSTKKKHVLTVMKRFASIILVAMITILGLTSSVGAALTDNLDGTITDDDRGDGSSLMWLQESFDVPMFWDEAMTWAETLVFAGYDDWRLPSANDFDTGLPDTGWNSVNNEWGHLYGVEWGNPAGPGDIVPMIGYSCRWYWTSTEDPGNSFQAYAFFVSYDFFWLNDVFPKAEMMCVTAVRDVVVAPLPPVASFTESAHTAPVGTSIIFDPIGSYDPDGIIVLYEWDFDGDGLYDVSTAISNPVSWLYTAPGTYTVTLRVTDNDDLTDTATDTKNITGLHVIPEVPFGTAMILFSMILASAAFLRFKRFRPKFQPQ